TSWIVAPTQAPTSGPPTRAAATRNAPAIETVLLCSPRIPSIPPSARAFLSPDGGNFPLTGQVPHRPDAIRQAYGMATLSEKQAKLFTDRNWGVISTIRQGGSPQSTPGWIEY